MKSVDRLLRIALAFPFLYASISSLLSPKDWLWYIPDWLATRVPPEPLLLGHGFLELLLGLWLITGKKTYYAAIAAAIDLTGATVLNIQTFTVVFRDVGLVAAAVALALLHREIASVSTNEKPKREKQLPN